MTLIDIHTHKNYSPPEIIVVRNIFAGEDPDGSDQGQYYSVGLHPWHIKQDTENQKLIEQVELSATSEKVIFIGECGLDKVCGIDPDIQKEIFIAQAEIAEKTGKPVIIHCVRSYEEVFKIRRDLKATSPWILHGFAGSIQLAEQLAGSGFLFSFGKILFYPKMKATEAFRKLPVEVLFLETDEFPAGIEEIYQKASFLRDTNILQLAESIESNFNRLLQKG